MEQIGWYGLKTSQQLATWVEYRSNKNDQQEKSVLSAQDTWNQS